MTKIPTVIITDSDKAAAVEQERARLMALFDGADPNKLDFIRDAVQQVAWLEFTIAELQRDIDERGPVVPFQNGKNQTGLQANPSCKTLKDFQQLYNTQFRALISLVPDKRGKSRFDALKFGIDYKEDDEDEKFDPDELHKKWMIDTGKWSEMDSQ